MGTRAIESPSLRALLMAWPLALGLLGCLLVYLWRFTDHLAAADNWNLLALNPLLLAGAILLWREHRGLTRRVLTEHYHEGLGTHLDVIVRDHGLTQ